MGIDALAGFDRYRFVEAFAAALLGGYVYDKISSGGLGGSQDAAQKFQRALLLAASHDNFTETVSLKYKQRVSLLSEGKRLKYIRTTLQPDQKNFDERLSALMIFDHAMQSNVEWEATLRMLSLDGPDLNEKMSDAAETFSGFATTILKDADQKLRNRADKMRSDEEAYLTYSGAFRKNRQDGMSFLNAIMAAPSVAKSSRRGPWKRLTYRIGAFLNPFP